MYRSFGQDVDLVFKSQTAQEDCLTLDMGPISCPKHLHGTTTVVCIKLPLYMKSSNTADLIGVAAEVWNHDYWVWCYRI